MGAAYGSGIQLLALCKFVLVYASGDLPIPHALLYSPRCPVLGERMYKLTGLAS